MTSRDRVPADLERTLMIETGYRCGMPNCRETEPLEIEHIEEWAKVREHQFSNMIVLCANCHRRKRDTNSPRHINRASLKKIKQHLMMLNGRYSDLERRVLEDFQAQRNRQPDQLPTIKLPATMHILVKYLIDDGLANAAMQPVVSQSPHGVTINNAPLQLTLSDKGKSFLDNLLTIDT